MAPVFEGSILSELLTLSFKRQYRRQVPLCYELLEAPFLELILELFLSVDELSGTES